MMAAIFSLIASGPASLTATPRGGIVGPAHGPATGGLIALAVIVSVALALAVMTWLVLTHVVASRRRRTEAMTAVYREIRRAMTDPLLVHQARRRIRESQARDR
jgi:hypothetical protein